MATIPATTLTALFASAAEATRWHRTNLGLHTEISHAGYDWTVISPDGGRAYLAGRRGWGGDESLYIEATGVETNRIVEAAVSATRLL
ncbi:hypothetical protein GTY54_01800 [Streptomyces sp. SID625]|nr:hypothetical protein [Streptomyces sp. SID625]